MGGIPLRKLAPEDRIQAMVERTAKGGGELVNLLGTSAWYAPGAAAAQMVDAVVLDEKRVLPCTAYLEGEYGIDGLYMGVPVVLGAGGIERIVELDLDDAEQQALKASADAVREVVGVLHAPSDHGPAASADARRSSAARRPGSASAAPSRSPRRARTSSCSPAAEDVLEREAERARRRSPSPATSRARDDLERLVVDRGRALRRRRRRSCSNSGGPPRTQALDVTDEQVEDAARLLLLAPIRLVRLCRPHLEASGHGRVIAITSSAVKEPIDTLALSSARASGPRRWLKVAARELGPAGVTVNCVAPGASTPTGSGRSTPTAPPRPTSRRSRSDASARPARCGDVVCFLASDRGAYVSGTTIGVDGGLTRSLTTT